MKKFKLASLRCVILFAAMLCVLLAVGCSDKDEPDPAVSTTGITTTAEAEPPAVLTADGLSLDGNRLDASVENSVAEFSLDGRLTLTEGAVWQLFLDSAATEATDSTVRLEVGENIRYLRVTSGENSVIYTLTVIREEVMHTVYMYTCGGRFIKPRAIADGKRTPEITPLREGYRFSGWYCDGVAYDFASPVHTDLRLVAHWEKIGDFAASDTSFPTYTTASAALNIVWRDYDNAAGKRPSVVDCLLTGNGVSCVVKVSSAGAAWEKPSEAPEGAVLSSGGGNWTVKITGLVGEYSFVQQTPQGYSLQQSGTSAVNRIEGYSHSGDDSVALMTANGRLYDMAGNTVVLRGLVSCNVGMPAFDGLVSIKALTKLKSLGVNAVRFTVQLEASEEHAYSYTDNNLTVRASDATRKLLYEKVCKAIDNASAVGIYAVLDWGVLNRNPNIFYDDAAAFFASIAEKYRNNNYLIYEICNEPNSTWGSSQGEDKSVRIYAEKLISVIRSRGADNVIIVAPNANATGLSVYSGSAVAGDDPIDDPINADLQWNVAYTFHCYPYNYAYNDPGATSYSWKLRDAIAVGYTVITTEMSPINASLTLLDGSSYDLDEMAKYLNFYLENDLAIFYFRYSVPSEYSEWYMFKPKTDVAGGIWSKNDLTVCGSWYYNLLQSDGYIEVADFTTVQVKKGRS